jgi:hypothetical protein
MNKSFLIGATACAALALAAAIASPPSSRAQSGVPKYEFDSSWPKPFPNRWVNGGLGGLCVDKNDHVLILNRQDVGRSELMAGAMAPPMLARTRFRRQRGPFLGRPEGHRLAPA